MSRVLHIVRGTMVGVWYCLPMNRKDDVLVRFGRRVRELRKQAGFTSQEAFADECGLDRTYIGGIERGERNVALRNVEAIAEALRVSLSDSFKGV